jgi:tetratricopeptide (TPR) repeat protein
MKPRAFVVMPFGKKPLSEISAKGPNPADEVVDFDEIYKKLLKPALSEAGCDPFRADGETAAGDIRTDMFFELVTADLVVADISVNNPNVFYELGVRHGVCPRGVLTVQGDFLRARPFDVAPDRNFRYDGSLFLLPKNDPCATEPKEGREEKLRREVGRLSQIIKHAVAADRQTVGSPLYEHLPGLVPVNWDKIQTSKAYYFGALRDDWLDCVRIAQLHGHPGDITTLADDAPTLVHRSKILYQAALALIDLCRYSAAERELRKVIEQDPNHFDAQLQLGRVMAHQGKTDQAEQHLRNLLRQHEDEPNVGDLLGQVYRRLWHLSWHGEESLEKRQEKAIANSHVAALAVNSFLRAQKANAGAYFAGFNALILVFVVHHLRQSRGRELAEIWPANLDINELGTVVQFCAKNARETAGEKGDAVEQFWTTTTLAGMALIGNETEKALRRIRDACSIPGATFFQLQTFQERLSLYDELKFQPEFIKPALEIVNETLQQKRVRPPKKVILWAGYPIDRDGKQEDRTPRFPESRVDYVRQQIDAALEYWSVGEGDLAICEGIHECDILFAEACQKRGSRVRLMLLDPADGDSHQALWPFDSEKWEAQFHQLQSASGVEVWLNSEHLGPAVDTRTRGGRRSVQQRHKHWLINVARLEAEPAFDPESGAHREPSGHLHGLFLWNHEGTGEDPNDPSYFVRLVNEFNGYHGQVKIISPVPPRSTAA